MLWQSSQEGVTEFDGFACAPLGQGNRYQHDGSRNPVTKVQELDALQRAVVPAAVIAVPIAGGLILVLSNYAGPEDAA